MTQISRFCDFAIERAELTSSAQVFRIDSQLSSAQLSFFGRASSSAQLSKKFSQLSSLSSAKIFPQLSSAQLSYFFQKFATLLQMSLKNGSFSRNQMTQISRFLRLRSKWY
jgi:hypothetical protein